MVVLLVVGFINKYISTAICIYTMSTTEEE